VRTSWRGLKASPPFAAGLYQAAIQVMLEGDFATPRVLLRNFINATLGFIAPLA